MPELKRTPWPNRGEDVTPETIICNSAEVILYADALAAAWLRAAWDEKGDRSTFAHEQSHLALRTRLAAGGRASLLSHIQGGRDDPADLARIVWANDNDGGLYSELAWEWLETSGYDPQGLKDHYEACAAEQVARWKATAPSEGDDSNA